MTIYNQIEPEDNTSAKESSSPAAGSEDGSGSVTSLDDSDSSGFTEVDTSDQIYDMKRREKGDVLREKYILGDVLGRGSFGDVREAVDMVSLARRAIKIFALRTVLRLPGELAQDEIRKINKEIHLLKRLNHANVIKIVDVYSDEHDETKKDYEKFIWMVMEYCAACVGELLEAAPDGRLPLWQCHLYFVQLIEGLEYLHQQGVIHGDIKPHNLLVNNDNVLKLTDFGTARILKPFDKNQVGLSTGTPFYDAPEIHIDETGDGFKLDIYSSGVTLFELATGRKPFMPKGNTGLAFELQKLKEKGHFEMTSALYENPGLHDLLHGMLQVKPANRMSTQEIKRHLWYKMVPSGEEFANIPPRGEHGDRYRSMTITAYLHEHFYPLEGEHARIKVPDPEMEAFEKRQKVPLVRGNRSPKKKRSPSPKRV
ncbi:Serine/threonine-protein kinase STK11 [Halotydeus destructor]|nr:Serine/threonine-protein kinase STK11 [Halotydeus destructor]